MRTSFKNFRRKDNDETEEQPTKRSKIQVDDGEELDDDDEYEEAVQALKGEFKKGGKGKGKHSTIKNLMEKTRKLQYKWIREEHPLISEVIEKFPTLSSSKWVNFL